MKKCKPFLQFFFLKLFKIMRPLCYPQNIINTTVMGCPESRRTSSSMQYCSEGFRDSPTHSENVLNQTEIRLYLPLQLSK